MRMQFPFVLFLAAGLAAPTTAQRIPDILVNDVEDENWRPAVAVGGGGGNEDTIAVAWMGYANGNMDIYFNRSTDGGRSWLANDVRLDVGSLPGAAWSSDPQIVMSDNGNTIVVCWRDFRGGTFPHITDIYCNRSLDGGLTWLPDDVRVNLGVPAGTNQVLNHRMSYSGDDVIVTWEDQRDGNRDIYFNRSSDDGLTWMANDVRLDTGDVAGSNNSTFPRHAVSGSDIHVVWNDFRDSAFSGKIYYNRSLDAGATWLPAAIRIDHIATDPYQGALSARVAASGDSVHVMWLDNRNDPGLQLLSRDVYYNRSLDRGATWLPADVRVNTGAPAGTYFTEWPDLCAVGSEVFAIWVDKLYPSSIAFNRSLDHGTTWLPTPTPLSSAPASSWASFDPPRIAVSGPLLLAAWSDSRAGAHDIYFNSSDDSGATWLPVDRRLNTGSAAGTAHSFLPVPAIDSTRPYVVWQDDRNGEADILLNLPFGHISYGDGLAGSGGFVPQLDGQGLARHGQTFTYPIRDGLGGALGVLALGLQKVDVPVLGGTMLVDPLAHLWFTLSGPAGIPGAGTAAPTISLPTSPAFVGLGIFGQAFVFDPGAIMELAISAGIEVWIG